MTKPYKIHFHVSSKSLDTRMGIFFSFEIISKVERLIHTNLCLFVCLFVFWRPLRVIVVIEVTADLISLNALVSTSYT